MFNHAAYNITFEEGWPTLQEAINQLIDILEGVRSHKFTSEEYILAYTNAYSICRPNPTGPESEKLYGQYKKTFEDYTSSKVLPSLREKKDEDLLRELVKRWNNHKVLTRFFSRFCDYLDRYFLRPTKRPSLNATSFLIFDELVYCEMNDQVTGIVISMIARERDGGQIDRALVKSVLDVYVELGEGSMKYYEDFEDAMLDDVASFYAEKASIWVTKESDTYFREIYESMKKEVDRATCCFQFTNHDKLIEAVEIEFLTAYATKIGL